MITLLADPREGETQIGNEIGVYCFAAAQNALYRCLGDWWLGSPIVPRKTYWVKPHGCRKWRQGTFTEYEYYGGFSSLETKPRGEAVRGMLLGPLEIYPTNGEYRIRNVK